MTGFDIVQLESNVADAIQDSDDKVQPITKKILVVGDWVVDEHWVTGIHRSSTSSRTGRLHIRALHPLASTIQSFCGAGRTASVLHRAMVKESNVPFCEIIGIGMWHKNDTAVLAAMLDPTVPCGQNPYLINKKIECESKNVRLFNIGEAICSLENPIEYGTTTVIRIYQHTGSAVDLIQRIDWELPLPHDWKSWIRNRSDLDGCSSFLQGNIGDFDAVVIKDMCKGVVSDALVSWLVDRSRKVGGRGEVGNVANDIPWFISTKAWRPSWLPLLRGVNVKLFMIPEIAARGAVQRGELNQWITRTRDASKEALELVDGLAESFDSNPIIAVLPNGLSGLVRDLGNDKKPILILRTDDSLGAKAVGLPMASVFFAALIARLLYQDSVKNKLPTKKLLNKALRFTNVCMKVEMNRINQPDKWDPSEEPIIRLTEDDVKPHKELRAWEEYNWTEKREFWQQAFSYCGIVDRVDSGKTEIIDDFESDGIVRGQTDRIESKSSKHKEIHLWRAMTDLDGYICCVASKRKVLRTLMQELSSFSRDTKLRSKSYMLIASPGSGKTYLARCLAKVTDLRYLPFNITQMLSKKDVLDCFDTIVTTQAQNPDETMLVFFDEINATLNGQHVYDSFLAPLEEGIYVRAGKTFHIDPCVWIFAGTDPPVNESDLMRDKSTKASDFESRLTLAPLNLRVDEQFEDMPSIRLEKVYLGAAILRDTFPDVRWVSEKVLTIFHDFGVCMDIREIKHFIKSFTNIQYGKVLAKNVPRDWLERKGRGVISLDTLDNIVEGEMIEIVS